MTSLPITLRVVARVDADDRSLCGEDCPMLSNDGRLVRCHGFGNETLHHRYLGYADFRPLRCPACLAAEGEKEKSE